MSVWSGMNCAFYIDVTAFINVFFVCLLLSFGLTITQYNGARLNWNGQTSWTQLIDVQASELQLSNEKL